MSERDYIDPYDFGADPYGVRDSTPAWNAAITAARAYQRGGVPITVRPRPGTYLVSTVDAGGFVGLSILADSKWSCSLYGALQTAPRPILDMSAADSAFVRGLTLCGSQLNGAPLTIPPACGILLSDAESGSSPAGQSTATTIEKCGSTGYFTGAALYVYGASDHMIKESAWQQSMPGQPVMFVGNVNAYNVVSNYRAVVSNPAFTGNLKFEDCEFHQFATSGNNDAIQFFSVSGVRIRDGNCANVAGQSQIDIMGTNGIITLDSIWTYGDAAPGPTNLLYLNSCGVQVLILISPNRGNSAYTTNLIGGTGSPNIGYGRVIGVPPAAVTGPYASLFGVL